LRPSQSPPPLGFGGSGRPRQGIQLEDEFPYASYPALRPAIKFTDSLKSATLASQFDPEQLEELLNPVEHVLTPPDDPVLKLSLLNYVHLMGHPQQTYASTRENIQRCFPDIKLLSHWQAERRARILSGLTTWVHHMCVNACTGFTGPYADLEKCPKCGVSRYKEDESGGEKKTPRKVFTTFPVGPQVQARWKNPRAAADMRYRWEKTKEIFQDRAPGELPGVLDDILSGEDYIGLVEDGTIKEYDTVLMLSIDGAQLYESKASDCWIYIWILVDIAPDKRYKIRNILPGGVIPGPEPPKELDSFLFPGLAHVSALQKEGLPIWDSFSRKRAISFLFVLLVLADSVAMEMLSGSVGHHGRKGCRLLCGFIGRNKVRGPHYYPALLRPDGFEEHRTSSHPDVRLDQLPVPNANDYRQDLFYVIAATSKTNYEDRRFETGIGKASIFTRIPRILPLPTCFGGDIMHQPLINLCGLLLDLWCVRPAAREKDSESDWPWGVLVGDVWVAHGKAVDRAAKYWPTSFDRIPRNPQEKISSGYKAWEYLNYIYGLGPGVFYRVLPDIYYSHFCALVRAIRIIYQRAVSREELATANRLLLRWVLDFEALYCQRQQDRLHFVRQCVHSLTHLGRETNRLGPLWLSSQWTMERVIGYLGSLIRQPSNPYQNLAAQAKRVATNNALISMWPDFDQEKGNPMGSRDLGDDYLLLGPRDTTQYALSDDEQAALEYFFSSYPDDVIGPQSIYRWGRLKIPTQQVARSCFKELERCSDMARTDRNIKVRT
jgi:hypothetical protein